MATYEFTYKVPDELYVNSFENNSTATAKVKLDDPVVSVYLDNIHPGSLMGTMVGSSLGEHKTWAEFRQYHLEQGKPIDGYSVDVDASKGGSEALTAWLAKYYNAGAAGMDSEERPPMVIEATAVPGIDGKTYEKITNPPVDHYWMPVKSADGTSTDLLLNSKSRLTFHEYNAIQRKAEVKFYDDKYDLGAEGESDAKAYLVNVDAYLTKMRPVHPWMDDGTFKDLDYCQAPKIPATVAANINLYENMNTVVIDDIFAPNGAGTEQTQVTPKDQIRIHSANIASSAINEDMGEVAKLYSEL